MSTELMLKALGVLLIFAVVGIPGFNHRLSYTSTRVGHSGLTIAMSALSTSSWPVHLALRIVWASRLSMTHIE